MERGRIKQQLSKLQLYTPFGPAISLLGIYPRDAKCIYEHHYLLQHCLSWQKIENNPNIQLACSQPTKPGIRLQSSVHPEQELPFSYAHTGMCSQREKLETLVEASLDFYDFCQSFIVVLPTHNLIVLLPTWLYQILLKISNPVLIK